MRSTVEVTPHGLYEFLLQVAPVRPVFVWGPPGVGKSSIIQKFSEDLGFECVSLLGSQLAPEDIIGIPQIDGKTSRFIPPSMIVREEPYVLFLDELNACSQEVQKAFYSLILEKKVGEFSLPEGSIVIGAGNRAEDSAIVRPMSSALINRMLHISLKADVNQWLQWAFTQEIHPHIIEFIQTRGDCLWCKPPKTEEPYSTPRSWHMLSDGMNAYGPDISLEQVKQIAYASLSSNHAQTFIGFIKNVHNRFAIDSILKGKAHWPDHLEDRDALYFLVMAFRSRLHKELPKDLVRPGSHPLGQRAKVLLKDLTLINKEMAILVVAETEDKKTLPAWFLSEVIKDIPHLRR